MHYNNLPTNNLRREQMYPPNGLLLCSISQSQELKYWEKHNITQNKCLINNFVNSQHNEKGKCHETITNTNISTNMNNESGQNERVMTDNTNNTHVNEKTCVNNNENEPHNQRILQTIIGLPKVHTTAELNQLKSDFIRRYNCLIDMQKRIVERARIISLIEKNGKEKEQNMMEQLMRERIMLEQYKANVDKYVEENKKIMAYQEELVNKKEKEIAKRNSSIFNKEEYLRQWQDKLLWWNGELCFYDTIIGDYLSTFICPYCDHPLDWANITLNQKYHHGCYRKIPKCQICKTNKCHISIVNNRKIIRDTCVECSFTQYKDNDIPKNITKDEMNK